MSGNTSVWARHWWGSARRHWPIPGCPSGSFEIWSVEMAEVIVALDLPGGAEALRLLDRLPEARWGKVGSILMTREGPELIRRLVDRGLQVFLDLKWHDIPNTVAEAVSAATALGAAMATVHTLGGSAMMAAAATAAAAGGRLGL